MAEARRLEDEDQDTLTGEPREPVVRRQPRTANSSGERSERHKEQRLSQGPLSSIRAAIKRTSSRPTSLSESTPRDRRRPEITILSAEPLVSNTWFPGASGGFPPPPPPAAQIWGSSIPPTIQPPPSYDEVIREKRQEQVQGLPPSSSSSSSLRSVSTTTIATQTDTGPESSVPTHSHAPVQRGSVARRAPKPPRPSYPFISKPSHADDTTSHADDTTSHGDDTTWAATATVDSLLFLEDSPALHTHTPTSRHTEDTRPAAFHSDLLTSDPFSPLTSASGSQTDHWVQSSLVPPPHSTVALTTPSAPPLLHNHPRPHPRTKNSLRPIRREVKVQTLVRLGQTGSEVTENQDLSHQEGKYLQELLDAFSSDDWGFPDHHSNDNGESDSGGEEEEEDMGTLRARIQAFELQQQVEDHGNRTDDSHGDNGALLGRGRPEPHHRVQAPPKPAPPVAPKPSSCKGLWQGGGSVAMAVNLTVDTTTAQPKPSETTSSAPVLAPVSTLNPIVPVPAPRPLLPRKPPSEPLRPDRQAGQTEGTPAIPCPPPRPPVAPRTKPSADLHSTNTKPSADLHSTNTKPSADLHSTNTKPSADLHSTNTKPSADLHSTNTKPSADLHSTNTKPSADLHSTNTKPCVARKPTAMTSSGRASAVPENRRPSLASKPSIQTSTSAPVAAPVQATPPTLAPAPAPVRSTPPALPPAPAQRKTPPVSTESEPRTQGGVKMLPLRPPPIKTVPGRPPPPQAVSASSITLANQPPAQAVSAPSTISSNQPSPPQDVPAPSNQPQDQRAPKRGPPLPPRPKPGHPLYKSYMKQDVLVLLEKTDSAHKDCLLGEESGRVQGSHMTVITPLSDQSQPPSDQHNQFDPASDDNSQLKTPSEYKSQSEPPSILPSQPRVEKAQPVTAPVSGPRCVARFDYEGEEEDELTFSEGDVIALTDVIDQEWGRGQIHGRIGIFPLAFTEILEEPPPSAGLHDLVETTTKTAESSEGAEQWAVALHDFPGQTAEDLWFQQGALIRVTRRVDADWTRGTLDGREGLFPTTFTHTCNTAQPMTGQPVARGVAKVLFDFSAESEDELSLKAGEVVTGVVTVDEEWYLGDAGGRRGLVPKNYLTLLPDSYK
ncbi:SH3 domain-containing protein 19 isoform X2 [Coregonus clupeaformis]|uniref:SH3 domain-containing protein 19 isoform X2 n=1 Tax=Coregonus clupeaformis TaxID=59861 RepID=UPI001BE01E1D|nr:SH3 domain-containing protein 19 isoform X2 [Coregonus clupeaformis]